MQLCDSVFHKRKSLDLAYETTQFKHGCLDLAYETTQFKHG